MVKHIILWKIKETYTSEEKEQIKKAAKEHLEALAGKVEGLERIHIQTEALASSTADLMLDSEFVNEEALKGYKVHPDHVHAADTYVRPFMEVRMCLDFEE